MTLSPPPNYLTLAFNSSSSMESIEILDPKNTTKLLSISGITIEDGVFNIDTIKTGNVDTVNIGDTSSLTTGSISEATVKGDITG